MEQPKEQTLPSLQKRVEILLVGSSLNIPQPLGDAEMRITEVQVILTDDPKVAAYISILLDECIAVRDLRLIKGSERMLLAMPARKVTERCPHCDTKNAITAHYCNSCGNRLPFTQMMPGQSSYSDTTHPLNAHVRKIIDRTVIYAFEEVRMGNRMFRTGKDDSKIVPIRRPMGIITLNGKLITPRAPELPVNANNEHEEVFAEGLL